MLSANTKEGASSLCRVFFSSISQKPARCLCIDRRKHRGTGKLALPFRYFKRKIRLPERLPREPLWYRQFLTAGGKRGVMKKKKGVWQKTYFFTKVNFKRRKNLTVRYRRISTVLCLFRSRNKIFKISPKQRIITSFKCLFNVFVSNHANL